MTQRVLFIAYHYPPENVIGAARPFRFVKYLQRQGFECHIITAAESTDANTTHVPDDFQSGQRTGWGFHVERAVRKFFLPGAIGTQWSHLAYHAGLEYITNHAGDFTTILSTFPPVGVHFAGYALARKTRRPWIADFRDPMAHNPFLAQLGPQTRAAYSLLEKQVVETADAILANTDASQTILRQNYPGAKAKIHLLWNGFDPEQRISALPIPPRPFRVFAHTGELYEGRTITPLLDSFRRLFESGRISSDSLRIELIGPIAPECVPSAEFLRAAESAGWLSLTPRQIAKADALRAAQTADGLLIVQPQSAVQVPGKVYEYIQIGRPLLALLPPDSAVERILAKSGVRYCVVNSLMPVDAFDRAVLDYLSFPSEPVPPSPWFEETFNAVNQTAALASLIEQLQRR